MTKYQITGHGDSATVSAILGGNLYVAEGSHPNFNRIVDALVNGSLDEWETSCLFDVAAELTRQFNSVSERVSFSNGSVYFDNDLVDNSLSDQISRFMEQGEDFAPLVKFMENVYSNPNAHSREQLYDWLRDREFAITEDGNFLAYKAVQSSENNYLSISSGRAIVNGTEQSGRISQAIGDVVTMPRSEVQFDPSVGCHTGLHAGTLDYASTFGGDTVVIVEINPRDVVSVPTDCSAQKLRTCRYVVKGVCEGAIKRAVVRGNDFYSSVTSLVDYFDSILATLWGDGEGIADDEDDYCLDCEAASSGFCDYCADDDEDY